MTVVNTPRRNHANHANHAHHASAPETLTPASTSDDFDDEEPSEVILLDQPIGKPSLRGRHKQTRLGMGFGTSLTDPGSTDEQLADSPWAPDPQSTDGDLLPPWEDEPSIPRPIRDERREPLPDYPTAAPDDADADNDNDDNDDDDGDGEVTDVYDVDRTTRTRAPSDGAVVTEIASQPTRQMAGPAPSQPDWPDLGVADSIQKAAEAAAEAHARAARGKRGRASSQGVPGFIDDEFPEEPTGRFDRTGTDDDLDLDEDGFGPPGTTIPPAFLGAFPEGVTAESTGNTGIPLTTTGFVDEISDVHDLPEAVPSNIPSVIGADEPSGGKRRERSEPVQAPLSLYDSEQGLPRCCANSRIRKLRWPMSCATCNSRRPATPWSRSCSRTSGVRIATPRSSRSRPASCARGKSRAAAIPRYRSRSVWRNPRPSAISSPPGCHSVARSPTDRRATSSAPRLAASPNT